MQYVRSISGSVSKTWNSINPATLSGAIDVIVVEQENGDLACSPFHVRFGKFSLLRPYEKKVEFRVNGEKTDFPMKLGEGGEAFFVFETTSDIPLDMQTSPLVSPAASPRSVAQVPDPQSLQEPEYLNIADQPGDEMVRSDAASDSIVIGNPRRAQSDFGSNTPLSVSPPEYNRPASGDWSSINLERSASEEILPSTRRYTLSGGNQPNVPTRRARSPPPLDKEAAFERALALSRKLSEREIPTQITDQGDVMLDMNGYKSKEDESLQAEFIARKILAEEIEGDYDIGALIAADRNGNLWIYSSEEAKERAIQEGFLAPILDSVSDAGYSSDDARSEDSGNEGSSIDGGRFSQKLSTPPSTPPLPSPPNGQQKQKKSEFSYAKTLRLTSAQLKSLNLKLGGNPITFSVGKATCPALMYYWKYDVPIVISDIDGTITKSDALGHVLTMIGRDWTHPGVAKLYTEIAANGYHFLYLTSRSVGQADSTRNYLAGIIQDKYKLPKGPVILSPDRTMAALRREVYLRKPEVFKMACLRDILNLFGEKHNPFYAGFGNRLTDALSYRSVNIPSTRIFTINSTGEVQLDVLSLNKYKSSYVSMRDLVDHFFPPVGLRPANEDFTDFNYWREPVPDLDDFTDSEDEEEERTRKVLLPGPGMHVYEDEEEEEEEGEGMGESYISYATEGGEEVDEEEEEEAGSGYEEDDDDDEAGEEEEAVEHKNQKGEVHEQPGVDDMKEEVKYEAEPAPVATRPGRVGSITSAFRRPWIKNDLDTNALSQMKDAVEKEVGAMLENAAEQLVKVTGTGSSAKLANGDEEKEKDMATAAVST